MKIILCSGLFLIFYKLFLQNEKMFVFNRFFLISALLISLSIPLMKIQKPIFNLSELNKKEVQISHQTIQRAVDTTQPLPISKISKPEIQPETALMYIYFTVVGILFIRFIINLSMMAKWTMSHQKIRKKNFTILLTEKEITPFSFLNYMFVSKKEYENDFVNSSIFKHELAHIQQKHSMDILFVEILKIVFWFNPFLYFYKKQIQLNHEFLADNEVLNNHPNFEILEYKELLIQKTAIHHNTLSSSFSYLSTKKRLIMMSKNTSRNKKRMFQTLSLPLLMLSILLFSQTSQAQKIQENQGLTKKEIRQYNRTLKKVNKETSKIQQEFNSKQTKINELNAVYEKMSVDQKKSVESPKVVQNKVDNSFSTSSVTIESTDLDGEKRIITLAKGEEISSTAEQFYNQATVYYDQAQPFYDQATVYYNQAQPFYDQAMIYYDDAMEVYSKVEKLRSENKKSEAASFQKKYSEKMSFYSLEMKKYSSWMGKYNLEMEKYGAEMRKYALEMAQYAKEVTKN